MVTDFPHLHLLDQYGNHRGVNRVLTIKLSKNKFMSWAHIG